ncbi:hypothetical protein HDU92_006145 [Lobulomyces angularis]|nr:hypothetical protein HDU92_006145 [Lobulomyces angularis]
MPTNEAVSKTEPNFIFKDAIHSETVKKEMKNHHLYENYLLTPAKVKDIVITEKPNEKKTESEQCYDEQYSSYLRNKSKKCQDSFKLPQTTSQCYGWETEVLIKNKDHRFHFPRSSTEITTIYGQAFSG